MRSFETLLLCRLTSSHWFLCVRPKWARRARRKIEIGYLVARLGGPYDSTQKLWIIDGSLVAARKNFRRKPMNMHTMLGIRTYPLEAAEALQGGLLVDLV